MGDYKEPFKKLKSLGSGGFATTWKADVLDHELINEWGVKEVAIKIPHDEEKERILIKEIKRNMELRIQLTEEESENIVGYLGFEKFDGTLVMVMKYIQGGNLRNIISGKNRNYEKMDVNKAIRIAKGILKGLSILHGKHIMHRDIKPENILMDGEIPKIADLGVSRMLKQTNEHAKTRVGSPCYISPELLNFNSACGFNTDLWSFGITFYEMLCGQFPFGIESQTPEGMVERQIKNNNVNLEFPSALNIPVPLQNIVSKALVRDPRYRYQTADEMLNDLKKYEDDTYINRCGDEIRELFNDGKINEAEERWKEAVKKYPQNPASYLGLGEFYNKCLQYKEAIQVFRKGIQHCPECALLYRDLALSLNAMNLKGEAINAMKKAKELGLEKRLQKQAEDILKRWEHKY